MRPGEISSVCEWCCLQLAECFAYIVQLLLSWVMPLVDGTPCGHFMPIFLFGLLAVPVTYPWEYTISCAQKRGRCVNIARDCILVYIYSYHLVSLYISILLVFAIIYIHLHTKDSILYKIWPVHHTSRNISAYSQLVWVVTPQHHGVVAARHVHGGHEHSGARWDAARQSSPWSWVWVMAKSGSC